MRLRWRRGAFIQTTSACCFVTFSQLTVRKTHAPGPSARGADLASPPISAERPTQPGASPTTIRAWARSNGFTVADRGRLPLEVIEAYGRARGDLLIG
jgi:hypothetical protein